MLGASLPGDWSRACFQNITLF